MDDGIDNIHRQYMPVFLLIIDVFLGIKQFVGDPIECFVPKELSGKKNHIRYLPPALYIHIH